MKDEYSDIELIERFQEGKLTDEERTIFNQRLLEDETFANTVKIQLNITEEIDIFWTDKMINTIDSWEKHAKRAKQPTPIIPINESVKITKEETSEVIENVKGNIEDKPKVVSRKKRRNWILYIAAAAVLLVLVIAGLNLLNTEEPDLFAESFEPYPDVISKRSSEESDLLAIGMSAYGEEKYTVAMTTLKRYLNEVDEIETADSNAAVFYLAVSTLGAGNVFTSIEMFNEISKNPNTIFQKQADWYVALAYLKFNDLEKGKQKLLEIQSNTDHDYNSNASELLKKLE